MKENVKKSHQKVTIFVLKNRTLVEIGLITSPYVPFISKPFIESVTRTQVIRLIENAYKMSSVVEFVRTRFSLLVFCSAIISIYTFYKTGSEPLSHDHSVQLDTPNDTANRIFEMKKCFLISFNFNQSHEINITESDRTNENIEFFEDILDAKKQPIPDRSIFFIESSCVKDGLAALNAR